MKGESLFHFDAEDRGHRFLSHMYSGPGEESEERKERTEV